MKKVLVFLIFLFLLLPTLLFANPVIEWLFGTSENCDLIYLPRTFVNNANVMIELSQAKGITESTTTADFANSDENHQAMFRIRDTLENDNANNSLVIEITSDNDWCFVNETNAMVTRPFSIGIICFDREYKNQSYSTFLSQVLRTNSSHKLVNGEYVPADAWSRQTTLNQSNGSITVSFDGTKYTISVPLTSTSDSKPKYMRELDFCIVLDETIDDLESGYYSTTLHVTTNKQHKTTSGTGGPLNETINLRGYIGTDPGENNATYSFLVSSSADTYSMDLDIPNHNTVKAYAVASVAFQFSEIVTTKPSDEEAQKRFTIYISPTPNYKESGRYQFIKLGSDNQARSDKNTIYYDLYIKTGTDSYTAMKSTNSSTNKAEGTIGSWGKYTGNNVTANNTYYMRPYYPSPSQISSAGIIGGETKYQLTWELQQTIWLKINSSSYDATYNSLGELHSSGMYWSYIYLTLETTY